MPSERVPDAIVHDYLTQRGGAERVVLDLAAALPGAPVYTSLFARDGTFPEFARLDVRPSSLDGVPGLRQHHRLALPLLAPSFSAMKVDAEVAICSSSGWAHGAQIVGRKIVYCHTPARWLYQTQRYVGSRRQWVSQPLSAAMQPLRRWDRAAAQTAHRYIANSTIVRRRIAEAYGIDAEVLPPPPGFTPDGDAEAIDGIEPGFLLCVSRLLEYKNVDALVEALRLRPRLRLVLAGGGPLLASLRRTAPSNVTVTGRVTDAELRWLYRSSTGLVAPSYEDFGLTPLEAASFAKPTAALRFGGYLDTVQEGATGVFFDNPEPADMARALDAFGAMTWSSTALQAHAEKYAKHRFVARILEIVDDERAML